MKPSFYEYRFSTTNIHVSSTMHICLVNQSFIQSLRRTKICLEKAMYMLFTDKLLVSKIILCLSKISGSCSRRLSWQQTNKNNTAIKIRRIISIKYGFENLIYFGKKVWTLVPSDLKRDKFLIDYQKCNQATGVLILVPSASAHIHEISD